MKPEINEAAARAEAIRATRKDRYDISGGRMKLAVNDAALDRENWEYRHVNDDGNRIHTLTQRGYEIVPDRDGTVKADGVGIGSEVSHFVGTKENGDALKTKLMRIPKVIYDDDQRAKQREHDEKEAAITVPADQLRDRGIKVSRSGSPGG